MGHAVAEASLPVRACGIGTPDPRYAQAVASRLGLALRKVQATTLAAVLHGDEGGRASSVDDARLPKHRAGSASLWASAADRARAILRSHRERYDGAGVPDGLRGETIPIGARILSVCEDFDAALSAGPGGWGSVEEALAHLKRHSGTRYDPRVVGEFLTVIRSQVADALRRGPAAFLHEAAWISADAVRSA